MVQAKYVKRDEDGIVWIVDEDGLEIELGERNPYAVSDVTGVPFRVDET